MRRAQLVRLVVAVALLGLTASALTGCMLARGSGDVTTEDRDVSGFDQVNVSGGGVLRITQGTQEGLTITADDNLLPLITTEVSGDTLEIGTRDNPPFPFDVQVWPSQPILYDLRVKDLSQVDVSGSVDVESDALEARDFEVGVSGSSKIKIKGLEADSLRIDVSGSCDTEISGDVDEQSLSVSGSGDFLNGDLRSKRTSVSISGSGDVVVWVSDTLDVDVSGSGSVKYWGSPKITQDLSGSAKVESLGQK